MAITEWDLTNKYTPYIVPKELGMPDEYYASDIPEGLPTWQGEPPQPPQPPLPPAPSGELDRFGNMAPVSRPPAPPEQPTLIEKFGKQVDKYSPILARAGAEVLKGARSPYAPAAGAWADFTQGERFSEAMKAATTDYLAGSPGVKPDTRYLPGMLGEQPTPQPTAPKINTVGLSPEQSALVAKTAMESVSKAKNEPYDIMLKTAQIHNTVAMGNYHTAQIPVLQAQLQKTLMELQYYPVKTLADISEKNAQISKIMGDLQKLQFELTQKMPAEVAETEQKTKESKAKTEESQEKTRTSKFLNTPAGMKMKAEIEGYEKRLGRPLEKIDLDDRTLLYDPVTNELLGSWTHGPKPGAKTGEEKVGEVGRQRLAADWAAAKMMPKIEAALLSRFKGDQKAAAAKLKEIREMWKGPGTEGMASIYLSSFLSEPDQYEFNRITNARARETLTGNLPTGPEPGAPTPPPVTPPPQKQPLLNKAKVEADLLKMGVKTEAEAIKYIIDNYGISDRVMAKRWLRENGFIGTKEKK